MIKERLKIVRLIAAMAWSDGYLDKQEKDRLRLLGKHLELDENDAKVLENYLESCPSIDGISFAEHSESERYAIYLLAAHYAYRDGLVWSGEQNLLDTISEMLNLSPEIRMQLEQQVKERKKR